MLSTQSRRSGLLCVTCMCYAQQCQCMRTALAKLVCWDSLLTHATLRIYCAESFKVEARSDDPTVKAATCARHYVLRFSPSEHLTRRLAHF